MKLRKPLRWKEGMFLRPQHFQQYDLYLENREYSRFRSVQTYGWGLLSLDVDADALTNFVLQINQMHAVLPDGSLIDVPGNSRTGGRSFDGLMNEVGRSMDVAVGVRARDDRGPQTLSDATTTGDTRYVSVEEEVYDLDAGRDPAPLEKLTYNLRMFMGDEPTDGYETIPLVRLRRTGDTAHPVEIDPQFSAPALTLSASNALWDVTRAIVERLARKLEELGQMRGSGDPDPLIQYAVMAGQFAVLTEMVQEGNVHPRTVYSEIVRLAGALLFRDSAGRSVDIIPRYHHRDPGPVFQALQELVFSLCDPRDVRQYERCPMVRADDQFNVVLPDSAKQAGIKVYLEIESAEPPQQLSLKMMTARVSIPSRIEFLRVNGLPGVPTEQQPGPPPALPRGQTGTYYRLKHEEKEWNSHVAGAGELTVFIMNCPQDVAISLVVVMPDA